MSLNLDILGKLSNVVAWWRVFTSVILGFPEVGIEYATARIHCTTNLGAGFPNDLSEMGWLGVGGVVVRSFIRPQFDSGGNAEITGTSS